MDSDIIRREIDRTTDRINDRLATLGQRTQRARQAANDWALVIVGVCAAVAAGMATIVVLRHRLRHRGDSDEQGEFPERERRARGRRLLPSRRVADRLAFHHEPGVRPARADVGMQLENETAR